MGEQANDEGPGDQDRGRHQHGQRRVLLALVGLALFL